MAHSETLVQVVADLYCLRNEVRLLCELNGVLSVEAEPILERIEAARLKLESVLDSQRVL